MPDTHPLILELQRLHALDDRRALAELRRALHTPMAALPYVARYFPKEPSTTLENSFITVAALFALHPSTDGRSIGQALARVQWLSGSDSVELRFRALLNSERADLPVHLRHAVALCATHEVPVDFDDLLRGLIAWNSLEHYVQRRWARDFWTYTNVSEPDTEKEAST